MRRAAAVVWIASGIPSFGGSPYLLVMRRAVAIPRQGQTKHLDFHASFAQRARGNSLLRSCSPFLLVMRRAAAVVWIVSGIPSFGGSPYLLVMRRAAARPRQGKQNI